MTTEIKQEIEKRLRDYPNKKSREKYKAKWDDIISDALVIYFSKKARTALSLRYFESKSITEVCDACDLSERTFSNYRRKLFYEVAIVALQANLPC